MYPVMIITRDNDMNYNIRTVGSANIPVLGLGLGRPTGQDRIDVVSAALCSP
jgi:hypothetical protein